MYQDLLLAGTSVIAFKFYNTYLSNLNRLIEGEGKLLSLLLICDEDWVSILIPILFIQ